MPIDPPAVQAIRHLLDDPEISEIMINGLAHLLVEITEVVGYDKDQVVLRDLFTYQVEGQDPNGHVLGRFVCSGERPAFYDKLHRVGGESVDKALAPSARLSGAA